MQIKVGTCYGGCQYNIISINDIIQYVNFRENTCKD